MIVVVDSGICNVGSILNMLKRVGAAATATSTPDGIRSADKLILPGVGAFDAGMANLEERDLIEPLEERVLHGGAPILGICLGMQMLTGGSDEGARAGLGWIPGRAVRFAFDHVDAAERTSLRIPHMGWNTIEARRDHPLTSGLDPEARFYFVHSYHVVCSAREDVLAEATYGYEFTAAVARDNVLGVQFHPEKSHRFGMQLLGHFAGCC